MQPEEVDGGNKCTVRKKRGGPHIGVVSRDPQLKVIASPKEILGASTITRKREEKRQREGLSGTKKERKKSLSNVD